MSVYKFDEQNYFIQDWFLDSEFQGFKQETTRKETC